MFVRVPVVVVVSGKLVRPVAGTATLVGAVEALVAVLAVVFFVPGRQRLAAKGQVLVLDGNDNHVLLVVGGC